MQWTRLNWFGLLMNGFMPARERIIAASRPDGDRPPPALGHYFVALKMRNPPSTKQLHVRSIYTALAIGFLLLLAQIWAIGALGTSKLNQISVNANKSATDYAKRVALALNIRQAAAEVTAEVRVYRARRGLKVPAPPLGREFAIAKNRFREEIESGRRLWGRSEQQ